MGEGQGRSEADDRDERRSVDSRCGDPAAALVSHDGAMMSLDDVLSSLYSLITLTYDMDGCCQTYTSVV